MAALATFPLRVSRPAVLVDGQRNATLTSAMMELSVSESADGLARCELLLGNWGGPSGLGFQYFGRDVIDFGKRLSIALGDDTLFDGRVTAITGIFPDGGPPQVRISAEDRLQDLRMTRRTRSFANASLKIFFASLNRVRRLTCVSKTSSFFKCGNTSRKSFTCMCCPCRARFV